MSSLINKVKTAISGEKNTPEAEAANRGNNEYGQGNEGTGLTGSHHHTGVDPRIDSGRGDPRIDSGRGTEGNSSQTGGLTGSHTGGSTGSHTGGLTGSNFGHDSTIGGTTGTRSGRDTEGYGSHTGGLTGSGLGHDSSRTGTGDAYDTTSSTGTGLRRDNYDNTTGATDTGTGHHGHHKHENTSSNYDSTSSGLGSTVGPSHHTTGTGIGSGIDSRRDNYDGTTGTTSGGLTGGITGDHHHKHHGHGEDIIHGGSHHTATANRLDPAVADNTALPFGGSTTGSSGRTGGLGHDSTTAGMGRGDNYDDSSSAAGSHKTTSGPHKSNLMNKLDPRVDSDRDGKSGVSSNTGTHGSHNTGTLGSGNADTYGSSNTGTLGSSNADTYGSRNNNMGSAVHDGTPLDAAKHRPSEFAAVLGEPEIQHVDHTHNRSGRHGSIAEHTKYGSGAQ